jgi:acyl-CoA synthetase (AMP-forming)/AMP-acid ligase II
MLKVRNFQRLVSALLQYRPESNNTLALQIERRALKIPDVRFLLFAERAYTYAEANAAINRHAHAYRTLGIGRGDVVALMMENRPEYLWHLFGLHKLGAVASLINANLSGEGLVHALRVCEPKCVAVGSELWPEFAEIAGQAPELASAAIADVDPDRGGDVDAPTMQQLVAAASADNPDSTGSLRLDELACYIYTSGTTGLPKAALIKHERLHRAGKAWASIAFNFGPGDVLYNCLPLYHSNGLLLATGSAINAGVTMALARRFSRRHFWDDIRKYDASAFIYIGELCRYLMNNAPDANERSHRVRVISGNGLRPDIWQEFRSRFGIKRVAEFYGATEGNCITVNFANVVGSVGPALPGMVLAKWSEAEQAFERDAAGFCIRPKLGEPGILLGKIAGRRAFDGYRNAEETEKKIVRNVFEHGDAYFNTGDLLKMDWRMHLHFTDRVGDTFRWKGENVSTTEVQERISKWPPAAEVNVYGVQVQGTEGRAGMAALVLNDGQEFDAVAFKQHVDASLPSYARPLFVRVRSALETTATLKLKKNDLQKQGFDPNASEDPIYFRDPAQDAYVRLEAARFADVNSGKLKL